MKAMNLFRLRAVGRLNCKRYYYKRFSSLIIVYSRILRIVAFFCVGVPCISLIITDTAWSPKVKRPEKSPLTLISCFMWKYFDYDQLKEIKFGEQRVLNSNLPGCTSLENSTLLIHQIKQCFKLFPILNTKYKENPQINLL